MRWTIHARTEFPATHALHLYKGEPEDPHEHAWAVSIQVGTDRLHEEGYALDFHAVEQILDRATEDLRDRDLGDHPVVGTESPTAERVAEVVSRRIQKHLADLGGTLIMVSVWEGPGNRVDLRLTDDEPISR